MVAMPENPEEYEAAIEMLPRSQLEKFAIQAAQAMEELEEENSQLKISIADVQKIDVEVINGWRRWTQTLDEEREKWASLATQMSTEKEVLGEQHKHALATIEALLRVIGDIEVTATEHSKEGTKIPQLRAGYKKVLKIAEDAVDKYSKMSEESWTGHLAEDSSDEES